MKRVLYSGLVVVGLVGGLAARAGSKVAAQEDSFLAEYYADNEKVLCRDYQTANGSRFSTYQWWVLGFVSGAGHFRTAAKRPMARVNVARVLELTNGYCRTHPPDTLAAAAIAVLDQLDSAGARQ
jgi:hypothetical protein